MIDERGFIETIATGDFKCVQLIESKKGSIRSNHMHKVGGHWLYVVSGAMTYREYEPFGEDLVDYQGREVLVPPSPLRWQKVMTLGPGDKIFTGPGIYHQTEFLEDTILVSCAITELDHASYEADTVRWGPDILAQALRC